MSAAIWNKDSHSMADLPTEILNRMLKHCSGRELINLSGVCTTFKDLVEDTPNFNEKVAFRVSHGNPNYGDGTKVLCDSHRGYECLSVVNIIVNEKNVSSILMGRSDWKHLRMRHCYFETADIMIRFLSIMADSLESIDFELVTIRNLTYGEPVKSLALPKIRKIASHLFQVHYQCTTLKELELRNVFSDKAMRLLRANKIEKFSLTYGDIAFSFIRNFGDEPPLIHIKELVIRDFGTQAFIGAPAAENFHRFLVMQTSVEEVYIDTVGRPQDVSALERLHESKSGGYYRRRQNQRREEFSQIFTQFLTTVLRDMTSVKKLTLGESRRMFYPFFHCFPQNQTITELCIRLPVTNNTGRLIKKVIQACPNARKLSVLEFGQLILEDCFVHMKNIESIDAEVIRLEPVPSNVKLVALKYIKFKELLIRFSEYLSNLTQLQKHNMIIEHLRGPSEVIESS